jgi:hypothetical protein
MKNYKILFSTLLLLLLGCASRAESGSPRAGDLVSVSIHGVNHSGDTFQFSVIDPRDTSNTGGGELIGPYEAGGIVCCFKLPSKWAPGTTVEIQSKHWLSTGDGKETSGIYTKHMVEVPPYASGQAGELWVLRMADGKIDVVSSDLQPNHPQWPGKIKGWPVPSRDFMLKRWELVRDNAEQAVKNGQHLIAEVERSSESLFREAWDLDKKYSKDTIAKFNGPEDPAYHQNLKKRYTDRLRFSEARLRQIMKDKP